jgi:hypothetical protein
MKLIKDLGVLPISSNSKYKARFGIYECTDCLTHFKANSSKVKSRNMQLCAKCAKDGRHKRTHGMTGTRLYTTWQNMKARCKNKSDPIYGGRGISVCSQWADSFEAFQAWATANGYTGSLEIDRKDNDLGYSPENCRWVNNSTQNANKRQHIKANGLYTGIHPHGNKFKAMISHEGESAVYLGLYNTMQEAVADRNQYIESNGLPHTKVDLNILIKDIDGITH